ncbi:SDR family NAD(P)-dependent oxidoreductase [Rubritalea tangerina]|uniref:SDR family NAD(P)-dependent oxidoreductase n=1 Tax=Rubritalea tangerina TaxID=430798 RepID=A0ABW4ZBN1_9BACT
MKLQGKVALVTGASGGIGSAICHALAEDGASIILHYHSRKDQCLHTVKQLELQKTSESQKFIALPADLLDESQVQSLVANGIKHFSQLDILVNNAGWSRFVPAQDLDALDDSLIQRTMGLKVQAPLYLLRACRNALASSPSGQVINITSVAGIASRGSSSIYAAANAALSTLTKSWARSLAPSIRVNAVAPGFVETGFVWPKDGKVKEYVSKQNHIGRSVDASEVAELVRFLCCHASAITGEEIAIDGGIGRLGVNTQK